MSRREKKHQRVVVEGEGNIFNQGPRFIDKFPEAFSQKVGITAWAGGRRLERKCIYILEKEGERGELKTSRRVDSPSTVKRAEKMGEEGRVDRLKWHGCKKGKGEEGKDRKVMTRARDRGGVKKGGP